MTSGGRLHECTSIQADQGDAGSSMLDVDGPESGEAVPYAHTAVDALEA